MDKKRIHPLIPEAQEELKKGNLSRRDFLRLSTLLGASLASAQFLAACAQEDEPEPTQEPAVENQPETIVATIKRGGVLRCATRVERVDHPARFSLVSQSHPWRHVFEYLTYMDADGITHPYLLKEWRASDDLMQWTLVLKEGITFNNGKPFTADDVVFNFGQWLSEEVGSSLLGAMSYVDPNGISKIDDYTVQVNFKTPSIFLPEHLYSYQACIVPEGFGGDITLEPIGTGAFTVEEYIPAERAVLKAREGYWRNGEDGKPLPYLDQIIFVQLGEDRSADVSALKSGQVDTIIEPSVANWEALKDDSNLEIVSTPTGATRTLRMRCDQEPWIDNRVRTAFKMCQNRDKILAVALQGQGTIGNDSHIAPAHPESTGLEPLPFDTAAAKDLLAEAGYADGVDVELVVASDWPESMAWAQALKEDAAAAGFNITLKTMPASQYWDGWTEWNLGITWWSHRPLAPMLLPLAYIKDDNGEFVPWNESRWADDEFTGLLRQAEKTIDLASRREICGKLEQIQRDRGSVLIAFYMNVWKIYTKQVKAVDPSPEEFAIFYETWMDA
ncbi:MAG: ABC transporter substrate-binding protein [Anaerolineales bacterium]|nr:ABC transporter substrate-binding protein [Anaerolineales bacterium]